MGKKTQEEFINEVNNITNGQYSVLGTYENSKIKILIKHNNDKCNNYEWYIKPNNFLAGNQRCPICSKIKADKMHRLGIKNFKEEVKRITNEEYEVTEEIYVNNKTDIKIKHISCGTIFNVTPNNFTSKNSRCPKCAFEIKYNKLRKSIEQVRQDIYNEVQDEYELISNNYYNSAEKILIKHKKCDNVLNVSLANFIYSGTRCECETQSKGEKFITSYLNNHNIDFIPYYKFDDCKNINQLSFDFYLNKHNVLIEFQGRQHYMPVSIFGGEIEFKKQIKNDTIKRNYCKAKNINLLEISYLEINKINSILDSQIINHDNTVSSLIY